MRLSEHFTLEEMTRSNTAARKGLDNTAPAWAVHRLIRTAARMELVRAACGDRRITVFSGYRSDVVNKAVGGSRTSSHRDGDAVDFEVHGLTVAETVAILKDSDIDFDQLIDEFGQWVHIGFGPKNRQQVIKARKVGGRTVYSPL